MNRFKLFSAVLFLLSGIVLHAENVTFRSGKILAAELSTKKPDIENFNPAALREDFPNKLYAAVVVVLNPERGLSIYDYSLEILGIKYPCIAIKTDSGSFDAGTPRISNPSPYRKYTLLFLVDGKMAGHDKREKLALRCIAPPEERSFFPIIFENRNSGEFTPPARIPSTGIMTKDNK